VFLDFQGSAPLADALMHAQPSGGGGGRSGANGTASSVRHVIAWPALVAPPVLAGWDFARVFFGLLRSPGMAMSEVGLHVFGGDVFWGESW